MSVKKSIFRSSLEDQFLNAEHIAKRWHVLQTALDHIDTLNELKSYISNENSELSFKLNEVSEELKSTLDKYSELKQLVSTKTILDTLEDLDPSTMEPLDVLSDSTKSGYETNVPEL